MRKAQDTLIEEAMVQHGIPGLSLGIMRGQEILWLKGYGLAQVELGVPASAESVYEIASVTKLFTASAIMQLAEAGQLALECPLREYLPSLPEQWGEVTVRHLLAHQSGIRSYTAMPSYWESTRLDISREAILDLVRDLPLDFPPGSRYAYDNTGYYLLGLLIEQISGLSYGEFLHQQLFAPLGMESTCLNEPGRIVPQRAAGYTRQGKQLQNALYYSPSGTFAAGGLLSSVRDLMSWAATLGQGTLLKPESQQRMWHPHPSAAGNERQEHFSVGLGWFLVDFKGRTFAGHNGGIVGFSSALLHFIEEALTVVLLCNVDTLNKPHEIAFDVATLYL